jgi:hypothetical protein
MKSAVEVDSGVTIYVPSFMTVGSGIQVMLSLLSEEFQRLHFGIADGVEGFMKYVAQMAPGVMIYSYIGRFMAIGSGIQIILRLLHKQFKMLQCWWIYGRRDLWNMPLRWPQMA